MDDKVPGPLDPWVEWFEEWKEGRKKMIVKTLVEFEFEVPYGSEAEVIRKSIKEQIINDGNAYYVDDEAVANMTAIQIKEFGI